MRMLLLQHYLPRQVSAFDGVALPELPSFFDKQSAITMARSFELLEVVYSLEKWQTLF